MAKILITGGAGYIGNVISSVALQNGHNVRAIDLLWFEKDIPMVHMSNPSYEFTRGDICDEDLVNKMLEGVDFVIHTAAIVGEPATKKFPDLTKKINQDASLSLIKKAGGAGVKGLIFLSTCSNYGIADGIATEDTTLQPLSPYSETKVNVEKYLMNEVKGLDWVICRLSTVYGVSPRMRFDLTVNDFTMNAYVNKYLDVFMPRSYRPYVHVFDVARVLMNVIGSFEQVKNNVFNVGFEGENYQKIQIADMVKKYIPDIKIDIVEKGTDLRDYQVDFSKLKKYFDLEKTHIVEDGVKEVVNLLEMGLVADPLDSSYYNTTPDIGDGEQNATRT